MEIMHHRNLPERAWALADMLSQHLKAKEIDRQMNDCQEAVARAIGYSGLEALWSEYQTSRILANPKADDASSLAENLAREIHATAGGDLDAILSASKAAAAAWIYGVTGAAVMGAPAEPVPSPEETHDVLIALAAMMGNGAPQRDAVAALATAYRQADEECAVARCLEALYRRIQEGMRITGESLRLSGMRIPPAPSAILAIGDRGSPTSALRAAAAFIIDSRRKAGLESLSDPHLGVSD